MKQTYRLTESELRYMIEESINEAMMDEGFFGGLGAIGSKFGDRMRKSASGMANKAGQYINNAGAAISNAYDNAKEKMTTAYGNAKKTYQAGSINQDAQKAVEDAKSALNKLVQLSDKLQKSGMSRIIGDSRMKQIQSTMAFLNQLSGQFRGTNTAMRNQN